MRVWLVKTFCPERHALLAFPFESLNDEPSDEFKKTIMDVMLVSMDDAIKANLMAPWCGHCKAPSEKWTVEIVKTPYETLEEAMPHLRRDEAEQREERNARPC
jgi:thiol-disulfide isomerase/thioredoxin